MIAPAHERKARWVAGVPVGTNGEDGFYAKVGRRFLATGVDVGAIKITRDGVGPNGYYDRVTIWSESADLLWEGPLHNLEGVGYV